MAERGRVTEIGGWERIDSGRHPLAAALALAAIVGVFVVALVGLGVAIEEGDRRVEIADIVVPSIEGLDEDTARRLLEDVGLIMEVSESANEVVAAGNVFEQEPVAGAKLEQGSPVTALVSTGPAGTVVPDTVGQQATEAVALLSTVGLGAEVLSVFDEEVRSGEVLDSDPAPGRRAPPDDVVVLEVSNGPQPRAVPQIEGRTALEAMAEIGRLKLIPGEITTRSGSGQPDGAALSIEPGSGTEVARGSKVSMVVAGPEEGLIMPAVQGLLESTAAEAMSGAGVSASFRRVALPVGDPLDGRVVRQGVVAGSEIPDDLVVELLVGIAPPPPTTVPSTTTPDRSAGTTPGAGP